MDKIQANEDMYTCKDKSKKPESLMSREELIEKIHDEKRKRLKLEKRERYRKIQEEMQEFEESDHDEFITMFRSVGQEQLSEEMLVSGKRKLTPSSAKALRGADGTPSKFQKVHANIQGPTNKKNCWETLINYSGTLYHEKPGTTNPCHNKHILQSFETIWKCFPWGYVDCIFLNKATLEETIWFLVTRIVRDFCYDHNYDDNDDCYYY